MPSHSGSESDDDELRSTAAGEASAGTTRRGSGAPTRRVTGGARPRSGGPVGLESRKAMGQGALAQGGPLSARHPRSRPSSARATLASGPIRVPAQHQWPVRTASPKVAAPMPSAYDAPLSQTAAGAAASQALRARPPSATRVGVADRPSPRARLLSSSAEANAYPTHYQPHFTCSSLGAGGSSSSSASGLAWAQRNHFSQGMAISAAPNPCHCPLSPATCLPT